MHFVEIHHKIGKQNRVSFVNTDKIIAFNPCYELMFPECVNFEYLTNEEMAELPKNPLITDYPDRCVKIVKYNAECEGDICYEISPEEFERIKKILSGV